MDKPRMLHWTRTQEDVDSLLRLSAQPVGRTDTCDVAAERRQARQAKAESEKKAPVALQAGSYWLPGKTELPDHVAVRALAVDDAVEMPLSQIDGKLSHTVARGAMPEGDTPLGLKDRVALANRHIGTGTTESHPVLSFTRDVYLAAFFARGYSGGRRGAKQLLFIDLRENRDWLDVSDESKCAQLGIVGKQRRFAVQASEVLLFRPITVAVHLVDVSWLFAGEGAVRLRR